MNPIRTYQATVVLYQHLDPHLNPHITVQGNNVKEAAQVFVRLHPDITLKEVRALIKETELLHLGAVRLHRRARRAFGEEAGLQNPGDKALPQAKRRWLERVFVAYRQQCPEEVRAAEVHKQHLEHLVYFWLHVRTELIP